MAVLLCEKLMDFVDIILLFFLAWNGVTLDFLMIPWCKICLSLGEIVDMMLLICSVEL